MDSNDNTSGVLAVKGIDFCFETNGEIHHTIKYDLMARTDDKCLVVRRGHAFHLNLLLNRPYDDSKDAISFIFNVSDIGRRGPSADTSAAVVLSEKGYKVKSGEWAAVCKGQEGSTLSVAVTAAPNCAVDAWTIEVDTKTGDRSLTFTHPKPVYILFNPWCSDDKVYMAEHSHRQEYVEEDAGLLYRGVSYIIKPAPWYYAQYEKDILDCALYLVRKIGQVRGKSRGDPIVVSRALSAAINIQDDRGVLYGNWGADPTDYDDGTHPVKWIGSLKILQKYYKKKEPVKYAQCWVYAGVLTSVMRALGIPCRPVSGFNAAHDGDGSCTIDVLTNDAGDVVHLRNHRDSVWNFHVWNEAWMNRADLGSEHNGWQVVDSTPQERSNRMYRCGPASLRSVYEGEVEKPYDCSYVFAQVNADKVYWRFNGPEKPMKYLGRETSSIGKFISTKAVGSMRREDITKHYKYPEGSRKERDTVEKALLMSNSKFARYYLNEAFNDVTFKFELPDNVKIGQDFTVVLNMKNRSSVKTYEVESVLKVNSVTYTGREVGNKVKVLNSTTTINPEEKKPITMNVTFKEYYHELISHGAFHIHCSAKIVGIDYDYFTMREFRVRYPDINITIDGTPKVNQKFNVTMELENPLPIPLNYGKFLVEGPGLRGPLKIYVKQAVAPGALAKVKFQMSPTRAGPQQISAKFRSQEMKDSDGFLKFNVENE